MAGVAATVILCLIRSVFAHPEYTNSTLLPTDRQILDFKLRHPKPIGLLTLSHGSPVDIRDMITLNTDLLTNPYFFDVQMHTDAQLPPERIVHAKGIAAWGYFEVTNDVSKYTKADVFNDVGKRTPVLARLSPSPPHKGGTDLGRDFKALAVKLYTREGNLDFLSLQAPIFTFKEPIDFTPFIRVIKNNPATNVPDNTRLFDFFTLKPAGLTSLLYILSDYGVPDGFEHSDYFPIHTYELVNKHGDRWYVRFNWRTERGVRNLTATQIQQIQGTDLYYLLRNLYNNIANKTYPIWRLDMDVLSLDDIQCVDYNPFDMTAFWKNGTYETVTIGRLVLNKNSDNQFRDSEQVAYDPTNLVPGIPGPIDNIFKARRLAYRDIQNYRISRNFEKVGVNQPLYQKTYIRDGQPPVLDNGRDAPNYFPNSYNGPVPFVDDQRPREQLIQLERNVADLKTPADFYNIFLKNDGERQRLSENIATLLQTTVESSRNKFLRLIKLIDKDFYRRIVTALNYFLNQASG